MAIEPFSKDWFLDSIGQTVANIGPVHSPSINGKALAFRVDAASSTVKYIGLGPVGALNASASWRILRITTSGSVKTSEYADGNDSFDNVWNNRASLSYS